MKAPKGSLEWLKQQQQAKSGAKPASQPAPADASGDAAPPLAAKPGSPALAGPPVAKPANTAPAPTYADLDALLSGKTPAAAPGPTAAPEIVAPVARPAYAVNSGSGSTVSLVNWDKGDLVPEDAWSALTSGDGTSLSLSKLAADGGELVLLVPESGHHTGGPGETWTKLLIDLQNMFGSQPDKVKAVAVSPESADVHAKMASRYNLKLFSFASDADRTFLAAHKVQFPHFKPVCTHTRTSNHAYVHSSVRAPLHTTHAHGPGPNSRSHRCGTRKRRNAGCPWSGRRSSSTQRR